MYYFQTDFDFTDKTKNLIIKKFSHFFTNNFEHDAEYQTLQNINAIMPIGKEINQFLKKFNLNFSYAGINAFISNTKIRTLTNPHVDVLHQNKNFLPIKSRFNIMILGNPKDPMIWWKNFNFDNPNFNKKKFEYFGDEYESLGIPGNTINERIQYLGQPDCIKNNLLYPSSFVNTSIAHALEISPEPRLILSVALNKSLDEYCLNSKDRMT